MDASQSGGDAPRLGAWSCVCPVYSFFLFSSVYGSSLILTAVVVGCYLSIAYHLTYKLYRRARTSCLVSAILWLLVMYTWVLLILLKEEAILCLYQRRMSRHGMKISPRSSWECWCHYAWRWRCCSSWCRLFCQHSAHCAALFSSDTLLCLLMEKEGC